MNDEPILATPLVADAPMNNEKKPEPSGARQALVKQWLARVSRAKSRWKKVFDRMRDDAKFATGRQWPGVEGETLEDDRYVCNIVQRHIATQTAALYARNPTAMAQARRTLDFTVWDGTLQSLQAAQQAMAMAQQTGLPDPGAAAVLADYHQGMTRRKMLQRIAATQEIVYKHQLDEQMPPFKESMKQLVRRVKTKGVGYLKIGYQRFMGPRPEDVDKVTDATQQLERIKRLMQDYQGKELDDATADAERLRLMIENLQERPEVITKEGLVYDFPQPESIIVDDRCRQLKGFVGARFVAQEFLLTKEDVKEIYGVDVSSQFTAYTEDGRSTTEQTQDQCGDDKAEPRCCVYEVYAKGDGMLYVVCVGHDDFLKEPAEPDLRIESFYPFVTLSFNDVENPTEIYPLSDVTLMRPMQQEFNRAREALRQHRYANRPRTAVEKGKLDEEDQERLANAGANTVIELNTLGAGQTIADVLQPIEGPQIRPELYDTAQAFGDMEKVVGTQQADLGGLAGATATESSISEQNRMNSISSNIDDLDGCLSQVAKISGQVLLLEMSAETVKRIAGPGAVWPEMTANEVARDLELKIEAGSSGKPNVVMKVQQLERVMPVLMQLPGINPEFLAKQVLKWSILDADFDLEDALMPAMPSITAQNAMARPQGGGGNGGAQNDPNAPGGTRMPGIPGMAMPQNRARPPVLEQVAPGQMPGAQRAG